MPGGPKCPDTSIIPIVRYSERKISFDTLREWDTFFGFILILHKSGLDCVTILCLRRSDTTDRDPTFTSPPHRRVVSYVPQPYHSHTMSYVPPMSPYAPLRPTCTMVRPNLPIFPSHTPDLSVAGHMKYCLQFNTAPILIRPSMHARACRARNETCLGLWGRGKEVRRGLLLILQRLTTTSKNGNLSKTERRTGHSSFRFT